MTSELLIESSLRGELGALLEAIFIFEGRIDFLKTKHKDGIDSSHDTLAKHREPHDIIDHFADNADPSKKKIYTQKIVDWYKNKDFRQEDHGRVRQTLRDFETHKKKLPHSDIGKYKSFHHLNAALADFKPKQTNMEWGEFSQDDLNHLNTKGSTVVHDEPKYTVREVHDQRAMDILGKGTEWCVVSGKHRMQPQQNVGGNSSYFDDYKKEFPGSKFIHVHDKETGERFLNHHESGQNFFDEEDREQGRKPEVTSKYQRGMAKTLGGVSAIVKSSNPFVSKEDLHGLVGYEGPDRDTVVQNIIKHPNAGNHTHRALSRESPWSVAKFAKDPDVLHSLHDHGDEEVRWRVAINKNTADKTHIALSREFPEAVANRSQSPDVLHSLHDHPSSEVRKKVLLNKASRPDTQITLSKEFPRDAATFSYSPEVLRSLRDHQIKDVRRQVILNKDASLATKVALSKEFPLEALESEHPEVLHSLHTNDQISIRYAVAGHPDTRHDTLHTLSTDDDWGVRDAAKENLKKRGLL